MDLQLEQLGSLFKHGLWLLASFTDDAILLFLSRLGWQWAWLQWLSTLLLVVTVLYWLYRSLRFYRRAQSS